MHACTYCAFDDTPSKSVLKRAWVCFFFHRHGASLSGHTLYLSLCVSSPLIRPLVDVRLVSKEDTHERNELKSLSKDFV